ncbi:hypothetical protein Tco_0792160 [Tanacetum coccineum]
MDRRLEISGGYGVTTLRVLADGGSIRKNQEPLMIGDKNGEIACRGNCLYLVKTSHLGESESGNRIDSLLSNHRSRWNVSRNITKKNKPDRAEIHTLIRRSEDNRIAEVHDLHKK